MVSKCWGDNGIVSEDVDVASRFGRVRRGSRELIICCVGFSCGSIFVDIITLGDEYNRWIGTIKWLGYFVIDNSFVVDSCERPSQDPELDVNGLFGIVGSTFGVGIDVFFLIDFPPFIFFPLRCWDSWVDTGINSGENFSVRSYHRIAIGKICVG